MISLKLFNKQIPHECLCLYAHLLVNPSVDYQRLRRATGFNIQTMSRGLAKMEQLGLIKLDRTRGLRVEILPIPEWLADDHAVNEAISALTKGARKG